ncbi:MAG: cobalamin B12-binding domain-containing protein [Anaerolineae bacterium]
MRHTVLLYNPVSTSPGKQRLPLSLLAVAAVIAEDYDVEFIDGNLIRDEHGESQPQAVAARIIERARATNSKLLACSVMPGPQLRQAVPVCKAVKAALPDLTILWGGYFGTQHQEVVLKSGYIDYVIQGQGEAPFRQFVDTLHRGGSLENIMSLCYLDKKSGEVCVNQRAPNVQIDNVPWYL